MLTTRFCLTAIAVAAMLVAGGCSGDDDAAATLPELSPTEQAISDIERLYGDYWDAVITAEADLNPDPAQFDGVMTPEAASLETAFIQNLIDNDLYRTGEPRIGSVTVTLGDDQTSATAEACVDHTGWLVKHHGGYQVTQLHPPGPQAHGVTATRDADNDQWQITDTLDEGEASISC